jgi:hypothetical protein
MTITISPGNTKLGMIPSFSLSFASCPKYAKGTGCWHYCYARRLAYLRPTFRRSLERNYRQVKDLKKLESLLTIEIPKYGDIFRIHVAGDFFSQEYFYMWTRLARKFKHKIFYAYTKAFDIDFSKRPINLRILISDDQNAYSDLYHRFDGVTSLIKINNQHVCMRNCMECRYCFKGTAFKRVLFKKH